MSASDSAHTGEDVNGGIIGNDGACDVSQLADNFDDELHPAPSREETSEEMNDADDASSKYIVKRLKELYRDHVVEAEKRYHLHFNFCLPTDGPIKDSEFDATPMVLLIGQYSTGKVWYRLRIVGCMFLCRLVYG